MAGEIVVGYDGTGASKAALETAVELAADLGCPLVAVFGYEPYKMGGEIQDHAEALKERGEQVTAEAVERARSAGVDAEAITMDLHPSEALVALAKDRGARLIVVGHHGEGPLRGAILGVTPYRLVHTSETPVLVVRA